MEKYYASWRTFKQDDNCLEEQEQNVCCRTRLQVLKNGENNSNTITNMVLCPVFIRRVKLAQPRQRQRKQLKQTIDSKQHQDEKCCQKLASEKNNETKIRDSNRSITDGRNIPKAKTRNKKKLQFISRPSKVRYSRSMTKTKSTSRLKGTRSGNSSHSTTSSAATKSRRSSQCSLFSTEKKQCENSYHPLDQIYKLSSHKRRVLVGVALPAVNEKNYLACSAMGNIGQRNKKPNDLPKLRVPSITLPPTITSRSDVLISDIAHLCTFISKRAGTHLSSTTVTNDKYHLT